MSQENFEVTREGIKLPYARFLSDSAGGYTLFIILLAAFLTNVPLPGPFATTTIRDALSFTPADITTEIAVLLGIFLLLIGTPYGLALNATTWFVLGWLDVVFVNYWFHHRNNGWMAYLTYGTYHSFFLKKLYESFLFFRPPSQTIKPQDKEVTQQDSVSFYEKAAFLGKLLQNTFPEVYEPRIGFLSGIQIFTRNLSFLSILISIYALSVYLFAPVYRGAIFIAIFFLIGFVCTSVLSGLLHVYVNAAILFNVYVMCCKYQGKEPSEPQTFERTVEMLIAASKAKRSSKT
jgi:hypothetical protein